MAIQCDICGGNLSMRQNGNATCDSCGMTYSVEFLRQKMNNSPSFSTNTYINPNIQNLINLARSNIKTQNYDDAIKYADQILSIDYNNMDGWEIKIQALSRFSWLQMYYSKSYVLLADYSKIAKSKGQEQRATDFVSKMFSRADKKYIDDHPEYINQMASQVFAVFPNTTDIFDAVVTNCINEIIDTANASFRRYKDGHAYDHQPIADITHQSRRIDAYLQYAKINGSNISTALTKLAKTLRSFLATPCESDYFNKEGEKILNKIKSVLDPTKSATSSKKAMTYAEKFGETSNESLVKKLKAYNTKYLTDLLTNAINNIEPHETEEERKAREAEEQRKAEERRIWDEFQQDFEYEKINNSNLYRIKKFKNDTKETIMIPGYVSEIHRLAFENRKNIKSIIVQKDNPYYKSESNCIIDKRTNALTVAINTATIPQGITSIDDYAFYGHSGLTSITIPNSVTSIGNGAFNGCTSLASITIPNSVTSIGGYAFKGCTSLASITIPNSVTSIGGDAFMGCTSLASITIPNSVTSIDAYAFYNCSSLASITIPNGVTSIGDRVFEDCKNLTSITIPNSVTSIGHKAFWGCTSLASITIPNSVTSIGNEAFCSCSNLTSIAIPNGVTSIGDRVFEDCKNLTNITIPNSVKAIGNHAFQKCSNLTKISIPNSVTRIGNEAFSHCEKLTNIIIPNSVKLIGDKAFEECKKLKKITFNGKASEWRKSFGRQENTLWRKFFGVSTFGVETFTTLLLLILWPFSCILLPLWLPIFIFSTGYRKKGSFLGVAFIAPFILIISFVVWIFSSRVKIICTNRTIRQVLC